MLDGSDTNEVFLNSTTQPEAVQAICAEFGPLFNQIQTLVCFSTDATLDLPMSGDLGVDGNGVCITSKFLLDRSGSCEVTINFRESKGSQLKRTEIVLKEGKIFVSEDIIEVRQLIGAEPEVEARWPNTNVIILSLDNATATRIIEMHGKIQELSAAASTSEVEIGG